MRRPKKPKYKNIKVEIDGVKFDSKKEAKRYQDLKLLERSGGIKNLELQPEFVIADAVVLDGRKRPARKYKADFSYMRDGKLVVEDVKGIKTPMYRLKRHLVKLIHGIEVTEI
ncbi:DUF1064 domain-containing protein [Psychrobacter sp. I-STPA6b]|uniref:DUF1064 domain-containing protein n=1 Tax=Psychrobacter sp. I-STPA6b TaxID=2585718 RepID=UPI001D0C9157|nr:DUF1064 domain-containing protein [Psychrobacter sp. I-STPA6b]